MGTYQWTAPAGTDPVEDGGAVGQLVLRHLLGDDFTVAHTIAGPATKVDEGVYEWVLPAALVESRYWPQVSYDPDGSGDVVVNQPAVNLPGWETTGRVVSPWQVAVELGLSLPLTDLQTSRIVEQINRAQGRVRTYLNRPLTVTRRTYTDQWADSRFELTDQRAWPWLTTSINDTFTVVSVTATGATYTVEVDVGLDCTSDDTQSVRDFIVADAAAALRNTPGAQLGHRQVTSVSADGQSVSYAAGPTTGQGTTPAGGSPHLSDLARFRRRVVVQSPRTHAVFPYYDQVSAW